MKKHHKAPLPAALVVLVALCGCSDGASDKDLTHPFLAKSSWPIIHHSPAQEASSPLAGPDGAAAGLVVDFLGSVQGPASVLFDSQGSLYVMGVDFFEKKHIFMKLAAGSLEQMDAIEMSIASPLEGLYSFVDFEDCWWNGHTQVIMRLCSRGETLVQDMSFNLLELYPGLMNEDDSIIGLMPLYESPGMIDIAFVTTGLKPVHEGGEFTKIVVGAKVGLLRVAEGGESELVVNTYEDENISNNSALDPDGNLYVLTNRRALKLRVEGSGDGTRLAEAWSKPYESGDPIPSFPCDDETLIDVCELLARQADVKFADGSGTTPTLFGDNLQYIAFTDGSRPLTLVVLRTQDGSSVAIDAPHPFSGPESQTENTITASGNRFALESNSTKGAAAYRLSGGDVEERAELVWVNEDIFAPNGVPLISAESNALYLYEMQGDSPWSDETEWFVTALDLDTGELLWRQLIGAGLDYNSVYAPLCIDHRRRMYIGLYGGLLRLMDRAVE
ncbi:MAG: hypothetical protein ABIJ56_07695 [Pseudomonadota bacterium]